MTLDEFVRLDPKQIRTDKELMQLFVNFYEAAFSFIPKCAGCAFTSGFKMLKTFALTNEKNVKFDKNIQTMKAIKTFEVKRQYLTKILTFTNEGKTYRKYGNALTEEFATELVNAGKTEYFSRLPQTSKSENQLAEKFTEKAKKRVKSKDYDSLDYRTELLPLYTELKDKVGNEAKTLKRVDITAFLIENEG